MKDHRTNHESRDYETVLRGEIADFIDAELQRRRVQSEKCIVNTPRSVA